MRRKLELLRDASVAFAEASVDPRRLTETIAERLTVGVGDCCGVFVIDEPSQTLRPVAFFHRDRAVQELFRRLFAEHPVAVGQGVMGTVARTMRPVLVAEIELDQLLTQTTPELRESVRQHPAHSLLALPLLVRGRCLGVLAMARSTTPEPYGDDDLRTAEDIAERAAMALEVSELLTRERAATQRATALADASKAIQTLDLEKALAALVRVGAMLIGDACIITLVEGGVVRTRVVAHRDEAHEAVLQDLVGVAVPRNDGPVSQAVHENRTVRMAQAGDYRSALPTVDKYQSSVGVASLMVAPLRIGDAVIGTLGVSRDRGGDAYTEADERFLEELADRAALAFHNAQLYEAAERASTMKDELVAAASHDLRTPITTVQLMIQSALRYAQREGTTHVATSWLLPRLERAETQIARLMTLIDGLLDVSRIDAGRLRLAPAPMDLAELAGQIVARFEDEAAGTSTPISLDAGAPVLGNWDRDRLDQVITNLLSNALKYGRGSPVTVRVENGVGTARLTVEDHGIGIAPENHARVFERFERAAAGPGFGGVGLGLWIVRETVHAMGGTVRVESELGEGAKFVVELPVAPA